jgi:hypothetical protein
MRKLFRYVSISALTALLLALTSQGLYAATLTVSNTLDNGAGSLRAALAAASDSDTIIFSVSGTITLTTGQLVVARNVTIAGPGAAHYLCFRSGRRVRAAVAFPACREADGGA